MKRTDSANPDFAELVNLLDADLAARDGQEHDFYHQFNKIDKINHVVVAYDHNLPVACGAMKEIEPGKMEIKRMYTKPDYRGRGLALDILRELERWAKEEGFAITVLETGKRQPEAITLYTKAGYSLIPNYGQYRGIENSVCFEKRL